MAGSLAKAWGKGEGVAHMTLSEAKQQFDEDTLRMLDPAAYHDLKAQEREENVRMFIADDQQRQVTNRAEAEERSREVLRDMLTTNNQVAYHDFTDRLNSTEHALDNMERKHRFKLTEARREYRSALENGSDLGDGHRGFLADDGKSGIDENRQPLNAEQLAKALKTREDNPNQTSQEKYLASIDKVAEVVTEGAKLQHYRQELAALQRTEKPAEGDANYDARMEDYNKKWARMLKALPEEDRQAIFKENKDAQTVYSKYESQVSAMRLDTPIDVIPAQNVAVTDQPAAAVATTPAAVVAAATEKADAKAPQLSLTGNFTQCVLGVANNNNGEEACFAAATDDKPANTTTAFNNNSGIIPALPKSDTPDPILAALNAPAEQVKTAKAQAMP